MSECVVYLFHPKGPITPRTVTITTNTVNIAIINMCNNTANCNDTWATTTIATCATITLGYHFHSDFFNDKRLTANEKQCNFGH